MAEVFVSTASNINTVTIYHHSPPPAHLLQVQMAKQKIVVKVSMNNSKRTRKALQIAVGVSGVESASLMGGSEITVTGDGIDSVRLVMLLRKSVGYTELVSVGPVEDKTPAATATATAIDDATGQQEEKMVAMPWDDCPHDHFISYGTPYHVHVYESTYNHPSCTIM